MTIKKMLYAFVLPLLLFAGQLFAQERVVTGTVTDTAGSPVSNASVVIKGGKTGTQTSSTGAFSIRVPSTASTLVISSVGFGTQNVPIGNGPVSVTLQAVNTSLSEVVVIGYGAVRKRDLTGSVTTVTSKDFQKGNITTPEQLIAGKVAGVSVISNSGQPGSGSTIRIRGGSSLNASNDPLFVIDGVPLDNATNADGTSSISGTSNPLSFINPNDIESFTVLKDASAAAIYGTRASNGVIIITTRKGTGGKLRVNFSSLNSVSNVTKKVDVLSADQFRAIVNANGTASQKASLGSANTNWQNLIYQTAFFTDNNISLSGGIKALPYRISLGYQNQTGVLRTDLLQKTSLAIAINPTFFDNHLKVDINLKGAVQKVRFATAGAIGAAVSFDPTQEVYAKSARFGGYYERLDPSTNTGLTNLAGRNPLGLLNQRLDKGNPERSIGNIQIDYKFHFLPDLRANLNLGYDVSKGAGTVYVSDSAASDYLAGGKGGLNNQYKQTKRNTLLEFYLNYSKDLKAIKSRFDVLAGYSFNDYLTTTYNYANYSAAGTKIGSDPAYPFDKPEHTLVSFFGRANYTFDDKYLLTATLRRDGSSRFGPANRWGLFPSVALAWKINEEGFLKNSNVISDLKLRLGYGVTGQQEGIGNYDYLSYYALSFTNASYQFGNTYYQMYRPGGFYANRKWEQTATTNAALDFGLLDNRVSGSIDFYYKKTKDLLNQIPQPAGSNFSAYVVANVGDMENKGVEFNINTQPIKNKDLTWNVGFNITYNKNTITNLTVIPNDTSYIGFPSGTIAGGIGGQFAYMNAVGTSKNTFYLFRQVYDINGRPIEGLFEDINRDGTVNPKDLYKGKTADPKVFLGFSTSANYRKWSAGFVVRANIGNYVYNNNYSAGGTLNQVLGNSVLYNASTNYLTTGFKGGNGQQLLSDYYIQNASFLRMDNLNIGYNAGRVFHNQANLNITATVQNVFVITKYTGLDPEISNGIDNNFYPRPRTFALGFNLGF